MRIRKIVLEHHPILGSLTLDFTDEEGQTVDTIILAGENGTGKTCILDLIYEFSIFNLSGDKRDETRMFEVEFSDREVSIFQANHNYQGHFVEGIGSNVFFITVDYSITGSWRQVKVDFIQKNGEPKRVEGTFFKEPEIEPSLRTMYSDVEINYSPREISSVTAKDLDEKKNGSFKSGQNLATEITQLLIDIQALDSQEFSQWGKENVGQPVNPEKIDTRIKRFTKAFDLIFPSKKFIGIDNINGHKEVLFQENNLKMSIGQLSSGEKQIVFRGGFLLKDKETSKGSIVLIDEPEISLHPNWQIEILDFYKTLFTNSSNELSSQIFVATHSPFIIHNPKRNNDKVIILAKSENGDIISLDTPEFYSWSNNQLVKEAFKIDYEGLDDEVTIFLEGETDEMYFNKAKEIYNLTSIPYTFQWIGRINQNGNVEFTGDTALNHTKNFYQANSNLIRKKIILLYDSDTNKPEENIDNLLIRKMPKNDGNKIFKIGVENLLSFEASFDASQFYSEKVKVDDYGAKSVNRKLDKTKLCNWICDDLSILDQKNVLQHHKVLIEKLIEELK